MTKNIHLSEINNQNLLEELAHRININELNSAKQIKQAEIILKQLMVNQEDKLTQEYQEAYQNPQRLKLAKDWEKVSLFDLKKRTKHAK